MKSSNSKTSLRNLLPEDTRALELATGFILAVSVFFGHGLLLAAIAWVASASILIGILTNNYKLRAFSCLIAGGVLLYMSLGALKVDDYALVISQVTLGMSSLYAYLINNQG